MLYSLENVTQEGNGLLRGHLAEVKTNFCFKPPLSYTFISLLFPNFMSLQFQVSAGGTSVQGQVVSHPPKVLELQQGLARDTKGAACWASFPSLLPLSQPAMASELPSSSARGPGALSAFGTGEMFPQATRGENQHRGLKQLGMAIY